VLIVGGHGSDAEQRAAASAGASAYLPGEPDGRRLAAAAIAVTKDTNIKEVQP